MSSLLDLLLAASLLFPPPVAAFTATSPVAVGQPVIYVDQSYDPAPGHFIVLRDWIGRATSFDTPGPHLVELLVEDDRGLWGVALHVVQVQGATSSPPPPPSPPPRPPAGGTSAPPTASIAPATVPRGGVATVVVRAQRPIASVFLELPASFLTTLRLPYLTVDYRSLNDQPPSYSGPTSARLTLYVPWSSSSPPDGAYVAQVHVTMSDGSTTSLPLPFRVEGTIRWAQTLAKAGGS